VEHLELTSSALLPAEHASSISRSLTDVTPTPGTPRATGNGRRSDARTTVGKPCAAAPGNAAFRGSVGRQPAACNPSATDKRSTLPANSGSLAPPSLNQRSGAETGSAVPGNGHHRCRLVVAVAIRLNWTGKLPGCLCAAIRLTLITPKAEDW